MKSRYADRTGDNVSGKFWQSADLIAQLPSRDNEAQRANERGIRPIQAVHQQSAEALTPNEANRVVFPAPTESNLEDIFIAEYHSARNGRNLESQFFSLDLGTTADLRSMPPEAIVLIFAIGYPTRFSSFETTLAADDSVTGLDVISRWCKLYLEIAEPSAWDHELRIPLRVHERYNADIGDPDGFSGSPVFFLCQDDLKQAHLGFAGMITHANREGRFLIYGAEHIRQVVAGLDV